MSYSNEEICLFRFDAPTTHKLTAAGKKLAGATRVVAASGPQSGEALLLRGQSVRPCRLTSPRVDAEGSAYFSFSAHIDVAPGDAVHVCATNEFWRVVRVIDERLAGVLFQRRVYMRGTRFASNTCIP